MWPLLVVLRDEAVEAGELVAAKLMGRWRSGAPLERARAGKIEAYSEE